MPITPSICDLACIPHEACGAQQPRPTVSRSERVLEVEASTPVEISCDAALVYRARIFEKFGTIEARHSRSYHFVGLGLTFCKLAVEVHGGAIGVDAGVPTGSNFWFTLPDASQA